MPYVHVRVARTLSCDQKVKIADEISRTLERIANKPPAYTCVTIEEVMLENWAIAGELLDNKG